MQQELIQLLQNSDSNNIKLGCILARANGYSDVDIVDNLKYWNNSGQYMVEKGIYLAQLNLSFQIKKIIDYYKRYNKISYHFTIWDYSDEIIVFNDRWCEVKEKQYNKTKAEYSTAFIDLIINSN